MTPAREGNTFRGMDNPPAWPPPQRNRAPEGRPWRFASFDLMQRVPAGHRARTGYPAFWFAVWPASITALALVGGIIAGFVAVSIAGPGGITTPLIMWCLHPIILVQYVVLLIVFWRWSAAQGLAASVLDIRPERFWLESGFAALVLIVTLVAGGAAAVEVTRLLDQPLPAENIVPPEAGPGLFWLALPGIVLFGPILEEVIFRGWMLPALKHRGMGWAGALAITSVVFGLLHIFNGPGALVYTTILGFTTGLARIVTGRIWAPVFVHVLNNLIAIGVPQLSAPAPV